MTTEHGGHQFDATPEAGRTLVVLGDSFTAGEGDPSGLGWTGHVAAAARASLPAASTVYPLGVCGQTVADVARRWRTEVSARSRTREVDHVLLAVGTNDVVGLLATGGSASGTAADAATAAAGALLDELLATGAAIAAVGVPPLPEIDADRVGAALDARWAALARERDVRWFDLHEPLGADPRWARALRTAPDGIHPDAEGYRAWADALLADGLLDWLAAPPPGAPAHRAGARRRAPR